MKRADEEFCKTQFDIFLRKFFAPPSVIWKEVAQQDEPPDYYLLLGNARFAVEVTVLMERVSVGVASSLPHAVISEILWDFVEEVEATAKAEGYLHGNYLVSFSTPIDNFASVRNEIQRELIDYVRDTGSLERVPMKIVFERTLSQQRPQQCGIQKVGNKPDRVISGSPVWVKWEGDAEAGLLDLLNESLDIKVDKLKDIAAPKILLLLDDYRFADLEMYRRCIPQISSLHFFHTVFIVLTDNRGFVLYSQDNDWSKHSIDVVPC